MTMWEEEAKVLRPKLYAAHMEEVRKKAEAEARRKAESEEYARQRKSPKDYLTLEMTWTKGGFDTVMLANFTIKSTLQFGVRDISGTASATATVALRSRTLDKTLFEVVPAKATKRFSGVNMGFVPDQMTRANCSITHVKT